MDDAPVRHLRGTQLVQFCRKQCVPKFTSAPDAYLKALKSAPARSPACKAEPGHGGHGGYVDAGR